MHAKGCATGRTTGSLHHSSISQPCPLPGLQQRQDGAGAEPCGCRLLVACWLGCVGGAHPSSQHGSLQQQQALLIGASRWLLRYTTQPTHPPTVTALHGRVGPAVGPAAQGGPATHVSHRAECADGHKSVHTHKRALLIRLARGLCSLARRKKNWTEQPGIGGQNCPWQSTARKRAPAPPQFHL